MKIYFYKLFISFFTSCTVFSAVAQAQQTITNLYTDSTFDPAVSKTPIELSLNSNWHVGNEMGELFTGSITETAENINNLYALATIGDNGKQSFGLAENITINNFTFDINAKKIADPDTGKTVTAGYYHRTDLNDNTLNVLGNFALINNSASGVWNPKLEFQNGTINVSGNLTLNNVSTASGMYIPTFNLALTVGGNIIFEGTRISQLYLGGNSSEVSGYIDFGAVTTNLVDFTYSSQMATRSFGGFKGTGKLQSRSGYETTVILTNSEKYDFTGSFAIVSDTVPTENLQSKVSITMNATDATKGRQIFKFKSTSTYNAYGKNYYNANLATVTVQNGRLDISMYENMKADTLLMQGGIFSAIGETGDIGSANFDYMTFSGGKIYTDAVKRLGHDFIKVANQLTKLDDTAKLTFEIGISAADLKTWLDSEGKDTLSLSLLSYATVGSNVAEDDFALDLQEGILGNITLSEVGGVTAIVANISVPEPATVAAIFGALALASAIYRHRK